MLLVAADDALFVTDGRYTEQSNEQLGAAGVDAQVASRSASRRPRSAQLLAATVETGRAGSASRSTASPGPSSAASRRRSTASSSCPPATLVEDLRRVKDAGEVDRIRARVRDRRRRVPVAAARGSATASPSGSSRSSSSSRCANAARAATASIRSSRPGPNGAKPHASAVGPRDRPQRARRVRLRLHRRRLLLRHDAHRVGRRSRRRRAPSLRRRARRASRPGARSSPPTSRAPTIDRASRDVIAEAGWADAFSHSTGHGVGLEIHEAPRVAATGRDTLLVGDVVTVEPGVYLPGIGGVRIEDTVVVTATGSEPLTLTPKDLVL